MFGLHLNIFELLYVHIAVPKMHGTRNWTHDMQSFPMNPLLAAGVWLLWFTHQPSLTSGNRPPSTVHYADAEWLAVSAFLGSARKWTLQHWRTMMKRMQACSERKIWTKTRAVFT